MLPSLNRPIKTNITPASTVAIIKPEIPYWVTIPYTITINAPVGPPMRNLDPPKSEVRTPATIAVIRPCCGVTPEAIPNAIARGSAIIPTITPAIRSDINVFLSYLRFIIISKSLGLKNEEISIFIEPYFLRNGKFSNYYSETNLKEQLCLFYYCIICQFIAQDKIWFQVIRVNFRFEKSLSSSGNIEHKNCISV